MSTLEKPYTAQDARVEYNRLVTQYDVRRSIRKAKGPQWKCCECCLDWPAEGFGAERGIAKSLSSFCVGPGHWRCCTTCANRRRRRPKEIPTDAAKIQCLGICGLRRDPCFFDNGASVCAACIEHNALQKLVCRKCTRAFSADQVAPADSHAGEYLCFACAPEGLFIQCTVCEDNRPVTEFSGKAAALQKQTIRRCNKCRTCVVCHVFFANATHMACNSSMCANCYKTCTGTKCAVCHTIQPNSSFPSSQVSHASEQTRNLYLRCQSCHTCTACNTQQRIKAFGGPNPVCRTCTGKRCCDI